MKTLQKIWQWISKPVAVNLPSEMQAAPAPVKQTWFVIYDVEFQRSTGFGIFNTAEEAQHLLDNLLPSLAAGYRVQQREG